jgi:hypothetical protein
MACPPPPPTSTSRRPWALRQVFTEPRVLLHGSPPDKPALGSAGAAYFIDVQNVTVTEGFMVIGVQSFVDNALLSGIQISLTGYNLPPTAAPTASPTFVFLVDDAIRINCGGNAFADPYTGQAWQADASFNADCMVENNPAAMVANAGGLLQLFQSNRYCAFGGFGVTGTAYTIPVPAPDAYAVRLYFANLFDGAAARTRARLAALRLPFLPAPEQGRGPSVCACSASSSKSSWRWNTLTLSPRREER